MLHLQEIEIDCFVQVYYELIYTVLIYVCISVRGCGTY